jgi:hypothetical protein
MPDSGSRSKMISLRLSEVEYEVLKKEYRSHGARNVSELARLALQRIMTGSVVSDDACAAKLAALDDRVHSLESQVSLLLDVMEILLFVLPKHSPSASACSPDSIPV